MAGEPRVSGLVAMFIRLNMVRTPEQKDAIMPQRGLG